MITWHYSFCGKMPPRKEEKVIFLDKNGKRYYLTGKRKSYCCAIINCTKRDAAGIYCKEHFKIENKITETRTKDIKNILIDINGNRYFKDIYNQNIYLCSIEGCNNNTKKSKFCPGHDIRYHNICSIEGCGLKAKYDLCFKHKGYKMKKCKIIGCKSRGSYKGLCMHHSPQSVKDEINEKQKQYIKEHDSFRIANNLRARVRHALRSTTESENIMEIVGCDINFFREYLKSKFIEDMNWNNYGSGDDIEKFWNIDHIIPCSAFDLTDPEEQRKCFHYTNQQPLWAIDNIRKGNKY